MPQCAVVGCNSSHRKTKGGPVRYHRFPGDSLVRAEWIKACGKLVQNCSTARICSLHFAEESYERDVQHELLGLPTRCRLKKGATPAKNLPTIDLPKEESVIQDSAIAILLAVGLVPAAQMPGGLPQDLNKMQIMEDVREGCSSVQPSSPGHAEEPATSDGADKDVAETEENGYEEDGAADEIEEVTNNKPEQQSDEDKPPTLNAELENGDIEKPENCNENHINEENSSTSSSEEAQCNNNSNSNSTNKRKSENPDLANKRLRLEIQENFTSRDKILNEFIEISDCNTVDHLHTQTEQILAEIRTLNDLAKEKEREWNNIIHLKKMKEELLLRMQRRKQVLLLSNSNSEKSGDNGEVLLSESQGDGGGLSERLKATSNQSILKANLTNAKGRTQNSGGVEKATSKQQRNISRSQHYPPVEVNGSSTDYKQNRQRPVLDVQSIIADYRQRHPETVPRRGRRIRGPVAQVHPGLDASSELGLLLNAMDSGRENSRPSSAESLSMHGSEPSFKDMLVQFAKLSQSERNELIQNAIKPPPPYPEVTVHPVPTTTTTAPSNSLLHGILTKSPAKSNSKTSFSPTLARLLTAPEKGNTNGNISQSALQNSLMHSNMSISEILSTSKARNEITITPVGNSQYESSSSPAKSKSQVSQDEEEAEDSADRLVIDESAEGIERSRGGDNSSDGGDEVPQCQGCNQKSALFVCAGCGNQWYCSRDCQVSAWDEHSEVCSG